jgi:hypothetical protein
MSDTFGGYQISGLDELIEFADTCKKNEGKLIRKAAISSAKKILKPIKDNTPLSVDGHHSYTGGTKENPKTPTYYPPGNLRKSFKIKALKQREPMKQLVIIGPTTGKSAKHDGWYGHLVETGSVHNKPVGMVRKGYDEHVEECYEEYNRVYNEGWGDTIIQDINKFEDLLDEGD